VCLLEVREGIVEARLKVVVRVVVGDPGDLDTRCGKDRRVPSRALEMPLLVGGRHGVGKGAFEVDDGKIVMVEPMPNEVEGIVLETRPSIDGWEPARATIAVDRAEGAVAGEVEGDVGGLWCGGHRAGERG